MSDDGRSRLAAAIIAIAVALGADRTRMRWRLQRLENRWRALKNRARKRVEHIGFRHKVCGECTAVADRNARVCASCGAPLGSRLWQVLDRVGLVVPDFLSASSLLGVCFIAVYARMMFAQMGDSPWTLDVYTLMRFGANYPPLTLDGGEWWRLLTSSVGHVGIWHLGFNLVALYIIGPEVERLYGRFVMPLLFAVTAVAGSAASALLHQEPAVSIGASGGIMGLIGIAAAWGHRDGTTIGRAIRDRMIKWTLYTFLFGFAIGADNWAHAGGLALGLVIGGLVPPRWIKRARVRIPLSLAGVAAVAAAVWLAVAPPARGAVDPALKAEIDRVWRPMAAACDRRAAGDAEGARELARPVLDAYRGGAEAGGGERVDQLLEAQCDEIERLRGQCQAAPWNRLPPEAAANIAALCRAVR